MHHQYQIMALALDVANHPPPIPITLHDILLSVNKDKWIAAMKQEFDALVLNGTFNLVLLPKGHKAISM
jgi:hypothetical protein